MRRRHRPGWARFAPGAAALGLLAWAAAGPLAPVLAGGLPAAAPAALSTPALGTGACPEFVSPCLTPAALERLYGEATLLRAGWQGRGEKVVVVVSYGDPVLAQDVRTFDARFHLPALGLTVRAPLGLARFDPRRPDMVGWQEETALDVETIHAVAPLARVVVLTSPIDETEGVQGLPQFLALDRYALSHRLGCIFSQSWATEERDLGSPAGRAEVLRYAAFDRTLTGADGCTVLSGSGDTGGLPEVAFPADLPWVTAVGGTQLVGAPASPPGYRQVAWPGSAGGASALFPEPTWQRRLPPAVQAVLRGRRGLPDVAAAASPRLNLAVVAGGGWITANGTSEATPVWAGLVALADQMAGHPLGDINPLLYQLAASPSGRGALLDIVQGTNAVPDAVPPAPGHRAVPGWDLVTGLGSPWAAQLVPGLVRLARCRAGPAPPAGCPA
ncbi:MAG TPA: S53 family peptidase [Candidatus Micrarchaeia archaeon]|nr:S53 family peptidase [Candidatus Micrarchaeia archaeon]